jgi:hypothetical protein
MRSQFPSFFPRSRKDLKEFWASCLYSFDANVLLNVYRVKSGTAEQFFAILDRIKDHIWLSHQAAYEFLRSREGIIQDAKLGYDQTAKELKDLASEVRGKLRILSRHPMIDLQELSQEFDKKVKSVLNGFPALEKKHPNLNDEDPYLERFDDLFRGKVGAPFDEVETERLHSEGERRFKNKVPPGYKDVPKDVLDRYGDFIMWRQILAYCKQQQRPLIFVTDDEKDDWWRDVRGQKRGPRAELMMEFFNETQQPLLMYTMDRFMENAASVLDINIAPEGIKDAREAREYKPLIIRLHGLLADDLRWKNEQDEIYTRMLQQTIPSFREMIGKVEPAERQKLIERLLRAQALTEPSGERPETPSMPIDRDDDDSQSGTGEDQSRE